MTESGHTVERRTVLRTIAASGVLAASGGLASAGSPSTSEAHLQRLEEAKQLFGDVEAIEGVFDAQGKPIAEALAREGYLPTATSPSIDSVVSRGEFEKRSEGTIAAIGDGTRNGDHVIDVRVKQRTESHEIEYHLHPGVGTGYAEVSIDDEDVRYAVAHDGTVTALTSSECCPVSEDPCDSNCGEYRCGDFCFCEGNSSSGTHYFDTERKCCNVVVIDGEEQCECSWYVESECDCTTSDICPDS